MGESSLDSLQLSVVNGLCMDQLRLDTMDNGTIHSQIPNGINWIRIQSGNSESGNSESGDLNRSEKGNRRSNEEGSQ